MNISIIGTGIFSTSLALTIVDNNHNITMWTENIALAKSFNKNHNLKPITNASIPKKIKVTNNMEETLLNSDLIISCFCSIWKR